KPEIKAIVELEIKKVAERLIENAITLELADDGQEWLAEHGYDVEFGARPLRRLIQNEVEDKLSDGILSGKFTLGSVVRITVDKEGNLALLNDDESYSDEGEIIVAPTGTPTISFSNQYTVMVRRACKTRPLIPSGLSPPETSISPKCSTVGNRSYKCCSSFAHSGNCCDPRNPTVCASSVSHHASSRYLSGASTHLCSSRPK